MPIERKLAAIMFTDIAGYTESMSKDEAVAISLLNKKESILKPLIAKHNGTYVKSTGDGSLSHFNSAVDAATCAKRFQESIYDDKDLNVRVGVHLGDTIFEKGGIRGDGVNIASRLESMAVEGGVFVSKEVHDQLANQKEFDGVSLGLQSMKGVGRLIEVYGLKGAKLNEPNPSEYQENKIAVHSDDEVPSIAIIPFDNKGADEDVFYAYGISADLISDCSEAGLIRVASKKDIEKLDYSNLDNTKLSKKLFVRYIATGELWRMGDMFQLSVELYDTKDKKVVWSDRWQEKWDNLPTIKGSLSDGLLKALDTKPKVEQKIETANTEAYEYYLRAKHKFIKRENIEDIEIVRDLLQKAIELDNNLILGKILLGITYAVVGNRKKSINIFSQSLNKAKKVGDKKSMAWCLQCIANWHTYHFDYDSALECYSQSLVIREDINDLKGVRISLTGLGNIYLEKKKYEIALDYYNRGLKINYELGDKQNNDTILNNMGNVYYEQTNYDMALDYYIKSLKISEENQMHSLMGCSIANIGNLHLIKGNYEKALDDLNRAAKIREALGDIHSLASTLVSISYIYLKRNDYKKAMDHLEQCLVHQNNLGLKADDLIWSTTYLFLTYKHLDKQYDEKEIHNLIKEAENIKFEINYPLYELLEDKSYLETAYNQIQEKASVMEEELKLKFLSYPIPKAIIEEWEKVK